MSITRLFYPQADYQHPLLHLRLQHFDYSPLGLIKTSVIVFILTHLTMLVIWYGSATYVTPLIKSQNKYDMSWSVISLCLMINIVLSIGVDYTSLSLAWDELVARDLLRLTLLSANDFMRNSHAAAQARTWRLMSLVISMRIAITGLMFLHVFWLYPAARNLPHTLAYYFYLTTPTQKMFVPAFGIFGAAIIEPFWRMRAMTALGLATRRETDSPPCSASVIIGLIWAAQVFILLAFTMVWSLLIYDHVQAFCLELTNGNIIFAVFTMIFLASSLVLAGCYLFDKTIQVWSMRRVIQAW